MSLIELKNVSKQYDETLALDNINMSFEKGKVYGVIGRNGAGKTTLLKIISEMIRQTSGLINKDSSELVNAAEIAFARDFNQYFVNYRIRDLFKMARYIYPRYNVQLEEELVRNFELNTKKAYGKSSKGMQTMVSVIIALASDAKVLMLDEPYAGLDPINREYFYKILQKHYFNEEKTVVISSHLINEIEGYFENAIIIDKGTIILDETLESIYEQSFVINGNSNLLSWLKANKKVVGIESIANQNTIYIYDYLTTADRSKITELSGSISGLDLQSLMIKLVTRKEVE